MRAGARTWDFIDMIKWWLLPWQIGSWVLSFSWIFTEIVRAEPTAENTPVTQSIHDDMQQYDACI